MLVLLKVNTMTFVSAVEFNQAFLLKFIKFGIVGVSGLAIDFGITYLLKEKLNIHKYLASSLGFLTATASNYLLNRSWTFHNQDPAYMTQFGKFFGVSLVGLALSNGLIYLLHDKLKWNFYFAKACAIALVSLWNFSVNYLYTFTE
jgi:putative flippase GtrA